MSSKTYSAGRPATGVPLFQYFLPKLAGPRESYWSPKHCRRLEHCWFFDLRNCIRSCLKKAAAALAVVTMWVSRFRESEVYFKIQSQFHPSGRYRWQDRRCLWRERNLVKNICASSQLFDRLGWHNCSYNRHRQRRNALGRNAGSRKKSLRRNESMMVRTVRASGVFDAPTTAPDALGRSAGGKWKANR